MDENPFSCLYSQLANTAKFDSCMFIRLNPNHFFLRVYMLQAKVSCDILFIRLGTNGSWHFDLL